MSADTSSGVWKTFFDADYARLWASMLTPERNAREAAAIWDLTGMRPNTRVLDAPCGNGRIARELAARGAIVVGVDQSKDLLDEAERTRGDINTTHLRYVQHDLRNPIDLGDEEPPFDVALNVFSSLGYGDEIDDHAILTTLAKALHPGGTLVLDTMHRDLLVSKLARGVAIEHTLPDGTRFWETPQLDAAAGRVHNTWYWDGPAGRGQKSLSFRLYAIPELIRLIERAGFTIQSVNAGLTAEPYKAVPPEMGTRVAIIASRA